MNPIAIINAIESILTVVVDLEPTIAKSAGTLTTIAEAIYNNLVNKTEITADQLAALEAEVDAAAAALDAPLPDDPAGTTQT
jgi:hypothetical protein